MLQILVRGVSDRLLFYGRVLKYRLTTNYCEVTEYSGTAQTFPFCHEVIPFAMDFLKSIGRQNFIAVKDTLNFIWELEQNGNHLIFERTEFLESLVLE